MSSFSIHNNNNKQTDQSIKAESPIPQQQHQHQHQHQTQSNIKSTPLPQPQLQLQPQPLVQQTQSFTSFRRSSPVPKDLKILCINFNQDHGCFAIGHELGFLVYNTDPIELRVKRNFNIGGSSSTPSRYNLNTATASNQVTNSIVNTTTPGSGSGIGHITMLHRTNYLAIVGGGIHPRFPNNKLIIWDDLKRKNSLSLEFDQPVLNILLSRIKIVVILIDEIIVYSFSSPPKKLISFETSRNEFGVADMSVTTPTTAATTSTSSPTRKERASSDTAYTHDGQLAPRMPRGSHGSVSSAGSTTSNASLNSILNHNNKSVYNNSNHNNTTTTTHQPSTILVFPGKAIGQIQIVDLVQQQQGSSVNIIKAHKSTIRNLCINKTGTMVASASVFGTLIRVHSTKSTILLYEFRRGIDKADITSMKFSHNDSKLAVLSDKYTLHIFNLHQDNHEQQQQEQEDQKLPIQENKHHALNKFISFLPSTLIPQYFKSTWSYCSVNTNKYHQQESELDTGELGWVGDDGVVIVWQKKKIWEKYSILQKSDHGDGESSSGDKKASLEYEIVRTSWKSLDSE
ncbi:HSV2 [Candida margitis]|uniref:HSV2 n=1 Tax=Candida margitis TaxID=1775924 RepID=UPI002225EED0|nr:HSV2 [Candida margitis]KAI5964974.1 HSV2 [Candida margitis]